nr:hypothetical protein [Streptomyces sp. PSKA30]
MGPDLAAGAEGYDLDARAERLAAHPLAAAAGLEMFQNRDRGFETGLRAVIEGIAATLRTPATPD